MATVLANAMSLLQPDEIPTAEPFSDSAFEDDDEVSTQSLESGIRNHHFENGRRYHAYREGTYPFPNDEAEQWRLDLMDYAFLLAFDGKLALHQTPSPGERVLDLGTGTGIWAEHYADEHPDAEVIGVDLSPIQPKWVPPNCRFELDDIEDEWTWNSWFDYIFCRQMSGSIADWPALASKAYKNLRPGGSFEIQDLLYPLTGTCLRGSFERTDLHKWSVNMVEAAKRSGRHIDIATQLANILRSVGFIVKEEVRYMPIGCWPRDPELKLLGQVVGEMFTGGLEGLSLRLFTRDLGWTKEETLVFLAKVRKSIWDRNVRAYFTAYAVCGRKPLHGA